MFRNQRVWMFVKSKLAPALLLQCVLSPSNVLLWSTKQPWNECPNQNDLWFVFFAVDMMLSCQSGGSLLKYIHLAIEFVGPGWLWLAWCWIHFLTSTTYHISPGSSRVCVNASSSHSSYCGWSAGPGGGTLRGSEGVCVVFGECCAGEGCKIQGNFNTFPCFPKILVGVFWIFCFPSDSGNPTTGISGKPREFIKSSHNFATLVLHEARERGRFEVESESKQSRQGLTVWTVSFLKVVLWLEIWAWGLGGRGWELHHKGVRL